MPGGQIDRLGRLADLLRATRAASVGASIISLDVYDPEAIAAFYAEAGADAPARLVVGLGGPQLPRPLPALNGLLDRLDQGEPPVPALVLMVTPAYVAEARGILGDQSTLVVDQMLVLDADPARARETARRPLRFLAGLPGYAASFARMGFTDQEIAGVSDRMVDELVAWGDVGAIGARIGEQLRAGADHVVLHVLGEDGQPGPAEAARRLADRLPI